MWWVFGLFFLLLSLVFINHYVLTILHFLLSFVILFSFSFFFIPFYFYFNFILFSFCFPSLSFPFIFIDFSFSFLLGFAVFSFFLGNRWTLGFVWILRSFQFHKQGTFSFFIHYFSLPFIFRFCFNLFSS